MIKFDITYCDLRLPATCKMQNLIVENKLSGCGFVGSKLHPILDKEDIELHSNCQYRKKGECLIFEEFNNDPE